MIQLSKMSDTSHIMIGYRLCVCTATVPKNTHAQEHERNASEWALHNIGSRDKC